MTLQPNQIITVISHHTCSYENPIKLCRGDVVTIEKSDPAWPGWLWCSVSTGLSGWVPEDILEKTGLGAKASEEYDATELTIAVGDQLKFIKEKNGWTWCESQMGECGWVPKKNMAFISSLTKTQETIDLVQKLFERNTPAYLSMTGMPARADEAKALFEECPPDKTIDDKIILGLCVANEIQGILDLALGYPDPTTVFLGLLLISQEWQGQQLGKTLYQAAEKELAELEIFKKIRLSVSETNKQVIAFWEKMGFVATGERCKYHDDRYEACALMMEKKIGG